jgi:M6 family metalloprotease-like protein
MILFSAEKTYAVPATPYPIQVTQPDGSEITIRLRGDEFFSYKTTTDGYLIVPDSKGFYTYARKDISNAFTSTNVRVNNIEKRTATEKKLLRELTPNPDFTQVNLQKRAMRSSAGFNQETAPRKNYPLTGSPKSLVILVNFADKSFVTPNPQTAFTNLLNQEGYSANGGTGSARDYFRDNSMGTFAPQFDVVGPFTLPNNMAFYGENDSNDDDKNPRQMVIDACNLADANGVNFAQYDTDSDGIVDNVFIYYAGYNEAEGAPANTVWPHRWELSSTLRLDGVRIIDYACTSELRGKSGANMCGIGTFVHEFGHVLGLPDYYPTDGGSHHTLSYWSVMDSGPYLNSGNTPPAYSAYDRFFLNWLTPTELKTPQNVTLSSLTTTNKAYIITQNGNHNLNGANPNPVEFFTLENRQKSGWDTFLPASGMLITRIFYNASAWNDNSPNNNASAMGVDIIEADGKASEYNLAGDVFPGSANVTSYTPTLRNGTNIQKPLTQIKHEDGIISFRFMGGKTNLYPPVSKEASDITTGSFVANWEPTPDEFNFYAQKGYYLTVFSSMDGESTFTEGFDGGLNTIGWDINATEITNSSIYSGKKSPAIFLKNNREYIQTKKYLAPASNLSFYIKSIGEQQNSLIVQGLDNENNWQKLDSFLISNSFLTGITKTYTLQSPVYSQFKLTYSKNNTLNTLVSIDDISVTLTKKIEYYADEKWISATTDTIQKLTPNRTYFYMVRSSDRFLRSDNTFCTKT